MQKVLLSLILVLLSHITLLGQQSDYGSSTIVYDITSNEAKDYKLKVTTPPNYDKTKAYKVLYYLDAWWLSEIVLGSYAVLRLSEKVEDIILVGITLDGDLSDWNVQRTYDYTPSIYAMPVEQTVGLGDSAIKLDSSTTGGADRFLHFLESKVFGFVERKFSIHEDNRSLIGHSFGGLFGYYVMQKKPDAFNDLILISPALWWNKQELLNPDLLNDFSIKKKPGKLYLSYGKNESKWIIKSNNNASEIINDIKQDRLDFKFLAYDDANHNSILGRAIYDGLLFLYGK